MKSAAFLSGVNFFERRRQASRRLPTFNKNIGGKVVFTFGAGDEARTRDPLLGKLATYK